ncbi:MAG: caspase family protein [Rhodanobacteraceae bacterium]
MKRSSLLIALLLALLSSGPGTADAQSSDWTPLVQDHGALEGIQPIDEMTMVDCLLPGQVRRSGMMTFIGPRLPVKTTAKLCEIRGGEYTAYDRANLKSSLGVWMDKAKDGDAQAQFYVGALYEKGMDQPPDYNEAAKWYRKAAANGSIEAKLSLAALMEEGHGMPADPTGAVNLYREAMGIKSGDLVSSEEANRRVSEADQRAADLAKKLEAQKASNTAEIQQLEDQIATLKRSNASHASDRSKLASLEKALRASQARQASTSEQLAKVPSATRSVSKLPIISDAAAPVAVDGAQFGRYHALIIGVQNYQDYAPLRTPIEDSRAVADVLHKKYGFSTTVLLDPDFSAIVGAIVKLSTELTPEDNLLIYFAGHGVLDGSNRGFWLPLDAQPKIRSPALPTATLAEFLRMFKARSILVVADSCFGSALSTSIGRYMGGPEFYASGIPSGYLDRKARYVLASGGLKPVLDQSGDGHSVFTSVFLKVLNENDRILTQTGLEQELAGPVHTKSVELGMAQSPELKKMRSAGDTGGAFFLVPRAVAGG